MAGQSIKQEVIGLLTKNRELTSAERAEIDTLGLALSLRDNDPMWGSVIWAWVVMPRKEWIDVAHRALAAEVKNDIKEFLTNQAGNSIGGSPSYDEHKIDSIKASIAALAARPAGVQANQDPAAIKAAVVAALESKKGLVSAGDFFAAVKDAAREFIGWMAAGIAALGLGLCLFIGYQFGKYVQLSGDNVQIETLQKQVSDLTSAVARGK